MTRKSLFILFVSQIAFVACKGAPPTVSSSCALDIDQAMNEYYELIQDNDPNNDPSSPPRECNIPAQEPGANMTFSVELTDFNDLQEKKMRDALERARLILNSTEFKERVLNHTFNGERTFVDNNGDSNEKVYETIMAAAETLYPEVDEEMDLDITLYYKNNSTVGYTYPDTVRIWVNNKFFSGYTLGQVAANAVHEWTHKIGYGHSFYNNAQRPYSVPYAVGSIIKELVDSM